MQIATRIYVIALVLLFSVSELYSQTWNYGAPFDTSAPPAIFAPAKCSVPRSYLLDSLDFPYPTTSWFKCLFLSKKNEATQAWPDSMAGWSPVFTYPYTVGLGTMPMPGYTDYSKARLRFATGYRPYATTVTANGVPGTNSVTFSSAFDWYFCVADTAGKPDVVDLKPFIRKYDDFSVTLKYRQPTGSGYMESPLVKGMAYVTVKYEGLIPFFGSQARTLSAISTDGVNFTTLPNPDPLTIKGQRFILRMNGDGGPDRFIYWVLYLSDSTEVKIYFDYMNSHPGSPYQGAVCFSEPYNGYLRAAYLAANIAAVGTLPEYNDTQNMTGKLAVLDHYWKCYPVGGTFSATIEPGSDAAHVTYAWESSHPEEDSLLMFALPHHVDILNPGTGKDTVLSQYRCIKGKLTAIKGNTWQMTEPLVVTGWKSPEHNLSNNTLDKYRDQLYKVLQGDRDTIAGATAFTAGYLNQINTSTYFGGKQLAKKGRIAVIADELEQWYPTGPVAKSIRDTLKAELNRWFDGTPQLLLPGWLQNGFRYDSLYGGMVNTIDVNQVGGDFGNSVYTDHHFHYGYFLYASAALAKADTLWGQAYKKKILLLARDIANPSILDPYFVKERNKDWFDGHCWAQGLSDAAGVGNNQESTSESVNAWYGMYLLGLALGDKNLENTGRLYLSTEIRSAQKYWQIGLNSPYPHEYTDLYKVVGNLYATSINSLVAFGNVPGDPRMVYGIQQIPTTPVNNALLAEPWCDSIFNFYYKTAPMYNPVPPYVPDDLDLQWATVNLASISLSKPGHGYGYYRTYLNGYKYYSDQATRNIVNFDDGQSKTNVLYNTLVNANANIQDNKLILDVNIRVIHHDTLNSCSGEVEVEVLNEAQADPPYHYFWLFEGEEQEVYTRDAQIDSLCAGVHVLEVIDGEFNIGYATVTIENVQAVGDDPAAGAIRVYPNPSRDGHFTISWKEPGPTPEQIRVCDMEGRTVLSGNPAPGALKIDLSLTGQPSGVYTLILDRKEGTSVHKKLIKLNP